MRLHRFYLDPKTEELEHDFWLHDERLRHQWQKVLRYKVGDQVVLFDGLEQERLYKILEVAPNAVHLEMITQFERKLPKRQVHVFFSLLKKDKNDWVLQKCTELGVHNFVPLLADRSEKTGFNIERAEKIVIEAAEQCGRSDIPKIREPLTIETALSEYKDKIQLYIAEETSKSNHDELSEDISQVGIFIGPEGGWTESEMEMFKKQSLGQLSLSEFTLRAETAAVTAATILMY